MFRKSKRISRKLSLASLCAIAAGLDPFLQTISAHQVEGGAATGAGAGNAAIEGAGAKLMTVKYLVGARKGKTEEVSELIGKNLITDQIAEQITPETEFEAAQKKLQDTFEKNIGNYAQRIATKALETVQKSIGQGFGNIQSAGEIFVGPDNETLDPQGGFKSSSHFYHSIVQQARNNEPAVLKSWNALNDKITKSTTGATEGGSDSINAVPVQYATDIFRMYGNVPDFSSKIFNVPMQSNIIKIPVLKEYLRVQPSADATANIQANVIAEASNITQSKAVWEQITLTLVAEKIVCPVSDELLEDNNVALGTAVSDAAGRAIKRAKNGGIIRGATTTYTGIIGHPCTLHQNRSVNNQVNFIDILGMIAKFDFDGADWDSAEWFIHPGVIPQLGNLSSGNYNMYFPAGGLRNGQGGNFGGFGLLNGRPINVTGWCASLGNPGDVILGDMKKYVGGYRNGLQSMMSQHVFFLTQETAFRFTERVNGRPGLSAPVTLEDGSTQVSPFVQLGSVNGGS